MLHVYVNVSSVATRAFSKWFRIVVDCAWDRRRSRRVSRHRQSSLSARVGELALHFSRVEQSASDLLSPSVRARLHSSEFVHADGCHGFA